jgi:hypothetical protein
MATEYPTTNYYLTKVLITGSLMLGIRSLFNSGWGLVTFIPIMDLVSRDDVKNMVAGA